MTIEEMQCAQQAMIIFFQLAADLRFICFDIDRDLPVKTCSEKERDEVFEAKIMPHLRRAYVLFSMAEPRFTAAMFRQNSTIQ
jgi:hypothetical protein